jgi:hypothetical protein
MIKEMFQNQEKVPDAEEVAGDGHPEEVDLVAAELAVDVEEDGKTK